MNSNVINEMHKNTKIWLFNTNKQ